MAENRGTPQGQNGTENPLQQLQFTNDTQKNIEICLRTLIGLMQNPNNMGWARNATTESQSNVVESKWRTSREPLSEASQNNNRYRSRGNILEDFENGLKDQLMESLTGSNLKDGLGRVFDTFQKEFGWDLRNIGHEAGKQLMGKAADWFKNSETGQKAIEGIKKFGSSALDTFIKNDALKASLKNVAGAFFKGGAGAGGSGATGFLGSLLGGGGSAGAAVAGSGASAGATAGASAGLATAGGTAAAGGMTALAATGWGLLIIGIIVTIAKVLGPALKGLAEVAKAVGKSFNREEELRKKRMENARKRLEADMEWMARKPFEILQQATEKWEDAWDSNLRKIGQTQGYDKEAVYALYEGYAEKLRKDNLESVINATDIVDKLSSVLESGLSGEVAEQFAYAATKLNAAIPTQDFFGYVNDYASIAANAMSRGMTQQEAIAEANAQLEQFASNLLYSSRELAGGFTTGLKDGASLFKDAVQIAQTAKTYNASDISGTLTSVSAIIGAVAPDLAGALVDNVVQAAIGGNNNTALVALRSLAGINAGNTDFLREMANNPKAIFSTLFTNLAQLQNMSPDNYMEVAEGLAGIFGIDKAAFARVDFNYLANAINSMNVNRDSLNDNLKLLQSGQTTTSAEQLKAQEINRVILDEGLAYIIDSEAGRMIQEHMWDEQRDNALMNNTYAVDLQGSALEFLEGLRKSMTTLLNFLNPVGFIAKGIANLTQTIAESIGNDQDLKEILQLGAVGSNRTSFRNLTTRGTDLELTTSLIEMMGGEKGIAALNWYAQGMRVNSLMTGGADLYNFVNDAARNAGVDLSSPLSAIVTGVAAIARNSEEEKAIAKNSRYEWGLVGKSFATALQNTPISNSVVGNVVSTATTAAEAAVAASNKRFEEFLSTAKEASATMSYEEWVGTAASKGISNFEDALHDFGRTEAELRSFFEAHEASQGAAVEEGRKKDEELFRQENRDFWDYSSGSTGVFQTALWLPFFGNGQKYDSRMDAVDTALSNLQSRIGDVEDYTVISGISELNAKIGEGERFTVLSVLDKIENDINSTFVAGNSSFQKCLADWVRYIAASESYTKTVSKSSAWSDLKNAEQDKQTQATLALANALGVFTSGELQKMDPQLQTNVLLGEIVVLLQTIMQQSNTQFGGLSLPDTLSALGFGITKKT